MVKHVTPWIKKLLFHISSPSIAIAMPGISRVLSLQGFEKRTFLVVFGMICLLAHPGNSIENDPTSTKTLMILQMDFVNKPENIQKTLLREMALLNNEKAVEFFVDVSLSSNYTDDIRREALKGMLALDSTKYRFALEALQTSPLQEDRIIRNLQLVEGVDLLQPFLRSLTFQEDKRIIDMKLSAILRFWKDETIEGYDFSVWSSEKAAVALHSLIQSTVRADQKTKLIQLWGKVRDEKTTKEMVKLLDSKNARVQESVIFALAEPGPSTVSALGRFLQKSKDSILRKRAIFALRKISSETAHVALKSYLPQATPDEKKWINEILTK